MTDGEKPEPRRSRKVPTETDFRALYLLLYWLGGSILLGIVIALFATRKNRSPVGWGIFGVLFAVPTALVLCFMPFLCPKCRKSLSNDQWNSRICPNCGKLEA